MELLISGDYQLLGTGPAEEITKHLLTAGKQGVEFYLEAAAALVGNSSRFSRSAYLWRSPKSHSSCRMV